MAAPRGDFVLDDGTGPVLLISAGIGVTPVLAMLHELAAAPQRPREVWWIHGARGPREHPLAAEAHALLASLPHAREHMFYSADQPRHALSQGQSSLALGRSGRRERLHLRAGLVHGRHAGRPDRRLGIDPARIHTELFGALASINPGLTGQAAPAAAPAARASREPGRW